MARRKTEPPIDETTRSCPECQREIPVEARRCAFCTSPVGVAGKLDVRMAAGGRRSHPASVAFARLARAEGRPVAES